MNNNNIAEEILILQEACFCYAKEIIKSKQILIPFAAFLNMENEIIIEDPILNLDLKENRIEYLSNKLNRLAYIERIKVWSICFDGILNKKESKTTEAICIEIHERNQHMITNLYYPYSWNKNKITFAELICEKE